MTNQEAIDTIKTAIAQVEWDYPMDYAAAFDMAIEALEKQNVPDINDGKWISVKDRIPHNHDCVLAYSSETGVEIVIYITLGKNWIGPDGFVENVTHWMPLPEKPEDET